jgi:hypothetical protein
VLLAVSYSVHLHQRSTFATTSWRRSHDIRVLLLVQVLGVLAHARIADHLATGPKTAADLASLTGAQLKLCLIHASRATQGRTCCLHCQLARGPLHHRVIALTAKVFMHKDCLHAAGLNEAKLFRVLRLAVAQNLLAGSTDQLGVANFRNNGLSATLREDHPNCTR